VEEIEPVEEIESAEEIAEDEDFDLPDSPEEEDAETEIQSGLPEGSLEERIKPVLVYLNKLLGSLPQEKIDEFARSEYFETFKNLFAELGLPEWDC
jgi:hypothetical protein